MQATHASGDKQNSYALNEIGWLPASDDNVAIAGRRLPVGTRCSIGEQAFSLNHIILEGHRFAVRPIAAGQPLSSWGLPFGVAIRSISPGDYVCNELMIEALQGRRIDFEMPDHPNFRDQILLHKWDEHQFRPGKQVPRYPEFRSFQGYRRSSVRGIGTRNMILILGATSRTASFARRLEERLETITTSLPNVDGIVAISHTEGSGREPLNNRRLLLRTLAGLMVHPNVGAVLAVDDGPDQISNESLRHYMISQRYPLDDVLHHFLSLSGDFQADLAQAEIIIRDWLGQVNRFSQTSESLAHLKLALQCGGSDAFSGVSGNPLAAAVAREVLRYGGAANLGETDELIGAETYMLQNVRDLDTARAFLEAIARFKERLSWHGVTAEGNPSGGNRYRGLYNIVLKSIGAAMKRHPDVRLDYVIDYAQRMEQPGFYFMDTPGNDLESIAGQVAGGSNLILFVTGNGSITNFPLVPTIKIMTTTGRFQMLANDMDVNAGVYQDGVPMSDLSAETLDLAVAIASGRRTVGERAGHAQVSIWRNWQQTDDRNLGRLMARPKRAGLPLPINTGGYFDKQFRFEAISASAGAVIDQVGLILPTSICSGQIARLAAARLNDKGLGQPGQLSRFVTLTHTEGCGVAIHTTSDAYDRTMIGYMTHPLVRFGLFLEHGCEKTHNDYMRRLLEQQRLDPARFGWASVQLDGGIDRVLNKIEAWFMETLEGATELDHKAVGLDHLALGLLSTDRPSDPAARALSQAVRTIVGAGGTAILPQSDPLLRSAAFLEGALTDLPVIASLDYGQPAAQKGFHVMETPSTHWVETLTGLGATGVEVMVAFVDGRPRQGHPLVPMIQVTAEPADSQTAVTDFDLVLTGDDALWSEHLLRLVTRVASRQVTPRLLTQGNVDFQITRGLLGIST
jgi:altronate dehydratase